MGEDRARREAEETAVPKANLAEEAVEAIGEAAAARQPEPSRKDLGEHNLEPEGEAGAEDTGSPAGYGADFDWASRRARH